MNKLVRRAVGIVRSRVVERAIAGEFDREWYLSVNPDVSSSGMDPVSHYVRYGAAELRNPRPDFDGQAYLSSNEDVRDTGMNPFYHWLRFGRKEGRKWQSDPKNTSRLSPLRLPGIFTPIDRLSTAEARDLDMTSVPEKLLGDGFPYRIPSSRVAFPILLYKDGPGEVSQDRIAQAMALTSGRVHVLTDRAQPPGKTHQNVRIWPRTRGPALRGLAAVLELIDAEFLGLWEDSVSPAISAWRFLDATMLANPALAYSGASLLRPDGRLWRSGHILRDGTSEIEDRGVGENFHMPFQFRLKPTAAVDCVFGLFGADALRTAIAMVDKPGSDRLVEALAQLSPAVANGDASALATQGCALAQSTAEPSSLPRTWKFAETMRRDRIGPSEGIVFIDSAPPMPDQDAGSVTASNFIDIFMERGAEVLFYSTELRSWSNPYTLALAARGVVCLTDPAIQNIGEAFGQIEAADFGRLNFVLTRIYSGGEYVERTRARFPHAKLIFNTVDLHGLRELREARMTGSAARTFSAHATLARERDIIQRCDTTILLSEAEMAELAPTLAHADLRLVPMVNEFSPPRSGFADRRGLMFVGGFSHYPNVDAVRYIIDELWAPIRRRSPDIVLKIVGPNFPDQLRDRLPEGIEVVGFVQDLDAALEDVRLTIAPLRYGAGIKGKIGTSLAHGVPCVATSLAAEGMGLSDGREVLIADDPEEFAEAVVRLNEDEVMWTRMSAAGYDFCESRYSRRAVALKLNALLDEVPA